MSHLMLSLSLSLPLLLVLMPGLSRAQIREELEGGFSDYINTDFIWTGGYSNVHKACAAKAGKLGYYFETQGYTSVVGASEVSSAGFRSGTAQAVCRFKYYNDGDDEPIYKPNFNVTGRRVTGARSCRASDHRFSVNTGNVRTEKVCFGGCVMELSGVLVGVVRGVDMNEWGGEYSLNGETCEQPREEMICPEGMHKIADLIHDHVSYPVCAPDTSGSADAEVATEDPPVPLFTDRDSPGKYASSPGSSSVPSPVSSPGSPSGSLPELSPDTSTGSSTNSSTGSPSDSSSGISRGGASGGSSADTSDSATAPPMPPHGPNNTATAPPTSQAGSNESGTSINGIGSGQAGNASGDNFCATHPELSICQVSGFSGTCGAFRCNGDAVVCAITLEQHKTNCESAANREALKNTAHTKLGNQMLAGTDPQARTLPTPENGETINLNGLDQRGFLSGGECLSDKNITVFSHAITIPFSKACPYFLALRYVIMTVAALAALRAVMGAVRS